MNYALLRESKVLIVDEMARVFEFDALASISLDLAYEEYRTTRKTLHSRRNYPISKTTAQSSSSLSLTVNLTDNHLEASFFEWMGFSRAAKDTFLLPIVSPLEPRYFTAIIVTESSTWELGRAIITSVDVTLDRTVPVLTVNIEAGSFSEVTDAPQTTFIQGAIVKASPTEVFVNGTLFPGFTGAGLSFQQQTNWLNTRGIHDIGTIYNNKRAIVTDMNATATLNFYYVNSYRPTTVMDFENKYGVAVLLRTKSLQIEFPHSSITKRLSLSDVYTTALDVQPMEGSDDLVRITFTGEQK